MVCGTLSDNRAVNRRKRSLKPQEECGQQANCLKINHLFKKPVVCVQNLCAVFCPSNVVQSVCERWCHFLENSRTAAVFSTFWDSFRGSQRKLQENQGETSDFLRKFGQISRINSCMKSKDFEHWERQTCLEPCDDISPNLNLVPTFCEGQLSKTQLQHSQILFLNFRDMQERGNTAEPQGPNKLAYWISSLTTRSCVVDSAFWRMHWCGPASPNKKASQEKSLRTILITAIPSLTYPFFVECPKEERIYYISRFWVLFPIFSK